MKYHGLVQGHDGAHEDLIVEITPLGDIVLMERGTAGIMYLSPTDARELARHLIAAADTLRPR